MKGINKLLLMGTVGKDPETKYFNDNNLVTKFTMATNRSYVNKSNEKIEETEWHNVEAWGKTAEIITAHVKKGTHLFVEGRIKTESYEAKDGSGKRYVTKVTVESFNFLPNGNRNGQNGQAQQNSQYAQPANQGQGQPGQYAPPANQGQPGQYAPPANQGQPGQYAPPANTAPVPPVNTAPVPPVNTAPVPQGNAAPAVQNAQQGANNYVSNEQFQQGMNVEDDLPF